MAVGLCSLGLAGLGAGLCKRNSVLNILGRLNCPKTTTSYYRNAVMQKYHGNMADSGRCMREGGGRSKS